MSGDLCVCNQLVAWSPPIPTSTTMFTSSFESYALTLMSLNWREHPPGVANHGHRPSVAMAGLVAFDSEADDLVQTTPMARRMSLSSMDVWAAFRPCQREPDGNVGDGTLEQSTPEPARIPPALPLASRRIWWLAIRFQNGRFPHDGASGSDCRHRRRRHGRRLGNTNTSATWTRSGSGSRPRSVFRSCDLRRSTPIRWRSTLSSARGDNGGRIEEGPVFTGRQPPRDLCCRKQGSSLELEISVPAMPGDSSGSGPLAQFEEVDA